MQDRIAHSKLPADLLDDDTLAYLKDQERKKRRISGTAWVEEAKAEAAMAEIRKVLSGFGIDCKYSHSERHHDLEGHSEGVKTLAYIDVWCDAMPMTVDELARLGFLGLIYHRIKEAGAIGGVNDEAEFEIPKEA